MSLLVADMLALLVYGPLIVVLHELGHVAFARAGGFRVTSFGFGLGRPLWRVELSHGVVLHVDRWLLAGGSCVAVPVGPPSRRRAWYHAGGLLLQLALAVALALAPDTWLVGRIATFNLLVAFTNLVPWRVGGTASDGWYLLDLVAGGRRGGEVLPPRPLLEGLLERERRIGSPFGIAWAELCLAWSDVLADRTAQAGAFFAKDPPALATEPWVDALYHYVHAEWHRMEGRPLAALRVSREAGRVASGLGDAAEQADGLLTLAQAHALVALDEPASAQRVLSRLVGVPGLVGRQAAVVHLLASLDGAPDDLELATWRVMRRVQEVWLDPPETALALWQAAEHLEDHRRLTAARGAREAARVLARRTLAAAAPDDRIALLRRLGPPAGYRAVRGRAVPDLD